MTKKVTTRKKAAARLPLVSWFLACSLVLSLGGIRRILGTAEAPPPRVTLPSGVLLGGHFSSSPGDVAFLGVPFAAPPVGNRRWKPPFPVGKWRGARQATQFGSPCSQLPAGWFPAVDGSEDCLYLNIWTAHFSPGANLPVIVYFHGGSNTSGYSQMNPLGPALSPLGVVIVSANYRLGPFGFLALPALTQESDHHSSGNYGLLDQLQALRWVQENISRFGGDPARVTVMGQSAGAVDICLLMASPLSAGLFAGAIMESGDCQSEWNEDIRTPIPYNSISTTGESAGERLAKDLRVPSNGEQLHKLRAIHAPDILKAWAQDRQIEFAPIVDGWVVPEQPAIIFSKGRQLHVPVIVGSNANEATVFGTGGPKTVAQYKQYLLEDTGKFAAREFHIYPAASDAQAPARYLQLQSDTFAYGAWSMARSMTRVDQKAYLYNFSFVEAGKRATLGAYHGLELSFLSDAFADDWQHTPDDQKLGEALRAYWTQFAKTGNPNAPGLPPWPAYDATADQLLDIGRAIRLRPVPPEIHALGQLMIQVLAQAPSPPISEPRR